MFQSVSSSRWANPLGFLAAPTDMSLADKLMVTNEHPVERAARVLVGLGALALVFVGPETKWGLVGLVPLATGALGTCPLYTLFGFSTCRVSPPPAAG